MYFLKFVVDKGRNEPTVASTVIDHGTTREKARVSPQKVVNRGISILDLEQITSDTLRY
jgi:hypothetical protein